MWDENHKKEEVSRFYYIIFFPILCQKAKKKQIQRV